MLHQLRWPEKNHMYKFTTMVIITSFFFVSCVNSQKAESVSPETSFFDTNWELIELDNTPIPEKAPVKPPFIQFLEEEDKVNGHTGCNEFFGSVELNVNTIKLGPLGMTRMACQEWMETEMLFLAMLHKARHYDIKGDMLFFLDKKKPVAVFRASGKE